MRTQHIFFFLTLFCFLVSCKQTNEQLLHKATTLSKEGRHDKAIELYTKVIKRNNKLQLAWYERGLAYMATKQYNQALADFNTVMAFKTNQESVVNLSRDTPDPDGEAGAQVPYADAFYQRAQVKFYVDSLESSFSDFQILIGGNYKKGSCLLWQGAILVKRGETDSACAYFISAKQFAATDVEIKQSNEATNVYCGQ